MNNFLRISVPIISLLLILICAPQVIAENQAALENDLAYLKDIPEISWVEFDGNDVYIGFNKRPADLKLIMICAALIGNKAYGFGVHLWAVKASYRGWRPGDGPYYCSTSARHGKIEKNNCR